MASPPNFGPVQPPSHPQPNAVLVVESGQDLTILDVILSEGGWIIVAGALGGAGLAVKYGIPLAQKLITKRRVIKTAYEAIFGTGTIALLTKDAGHGPTHGNSAPNQGPDAASPRTPGLSPRALTVLQLQERARGVASGDIKIGEWNVDLIPDRVLAIAAGKLAAVKSLNEKQRKSFGLLLAEQTRRAAALALMQVNMRGVDGVTLGPFLADPPPGYTG